MAWKSRLEVSNLLLIGLIAISAAAIPIVGYLILADPLANGETQESEVASDRNAAEELERQRQGEAWSAAELKAPVGEAASLVLTSAGRNPGDSEITVEQATLYLAPFAVATRLDLDDGLSRLLGRLPAEESTMRVGSLTVVWEAGGSVLVQGSAKVELSSGALIVAMTGTSDQASPFELRYAKRSGVTSAKLPGLAKPIAVPHLGEGVGVAFASLALESSRLLTLEKPRLMELSTGKELAAADKLQLSSGLRMEPSGILEGITREWFARLEDGVLTLEGLKAQSLGLMLLPWFGAVPVPRGAGLDVDRAEFRSGGAVQLQGVRIRGAGAQLRLESASAGTAGASVGEWSLVGGQGEWSKWGITAQFPEARFTRSGAGVEFHLDGYALTVGPSPMALLSLMEVARELKKVVDEFLKAKPHLPNLVFDGLPDFIVEARNGRWSVPLLGGAAIEGMEALVRARGGVLEEVKLGLCRGGETCSDLALSLSAQTDPGGVLTQASLRVGGLLPVQMFRKALPSFLPDVGGIALKAELRKPESSGQYRWNAEGTLTGLKGRHPMVSATDLVFPPITFSAFGQVDLPNQTLESNFERIQVGDVMMRASLDVKGFGPKPWVRFGLDVPEQNCDALHKALPKGLAPRLESASFNGFMAINVLFEADLKDIRKTLKLDVGGEFGKCVADFGNTFRINRLNSENYVHRVVVNGEDLGLEVGPGTPDWVPLEQIPKIAQQAAYGTEDLAFYSHGGFRLGLIKRAIILLAERGRFVYGGSTISQQLVKNLFLSREKTLARKFEEAIIVWQMEQKVSKDRILELYLNCIEYGPKIWGIVRAARTYFNKTPQELTLLESAFLMGLKPDPAYGFLQFRRGKLNKHWRKNLEHVLKRLREMDAIDDATLEAAMTQELVFAVPGQALPALELPPEEEDRPVREGQETPEQL